MNPKHTLITTDRATGGDVPEPLTELSLSSIDAYWRAANYLSVGQIYLLDNPLLREPLQPKHIKPRLLGHWGTTPGQNFIYVHLNRVIRSMPEHDLHFRAGPRRARPGLNVYLEGTYTRSTRPSLRMKTDFKSCFGSSHFPAESPATWHRKRPVHSRGR